MTGYPYYINVFVKDTCVLVVIAYLLARARLLRLLFREELKPAETVLLGVGLGLVGLSEAIFPDARFPYATHTLFVTFAAIAGGLPVGLITAAVVTVGATVFQNAPVVLGTMLAVVVSAFMGRSVRDIVSVPLRLVGGFLVGVLSQASRLLIHWGLARLLHTPSFYSHTLISLPANGFGVALLLLVVSDAQVRADSERRRMEVERHQVEVERAHALASEAQLAVLRARIHPHFLFNALNSIAELCCIAPERAEAASVRLSQLMRRALDTSAVTSITLAEELETVRAYVQIEQERLGDRLKVVLDIDTACEGAFVPPFAIQILVENAIHHGIAPKMAPGTVVVTARRYPRHTLLAVKDDGMGIQAEVYGRVQARESTSTHGIQILRQQLLLQYGHLARLRLFSQDAGGTLAAFALPAEDRQNSKRSKHPC